MSVRASTPEERLEAYLQRLGAVIAVLVGTGRNSGVHVNPYTGEVQERRGVGRGLTGACNAAFLS